MSPEEPRRARSDPALLVEVGLGILLLVLFLALYWVPAGTDWAYRPHWWAWPVLGILFFGLLLVDARRRRRRRHEQMVELHEEIHDELE